MSLIFPAYQQAYDLTIFDGVTVPVAQVDRATAS